MILNPSFSKKDNTSLCLTTLSSFVINWYIKLSNFLLATILESNDFIVPEAAFLQFWNSSKPCSFLSWLTFCKDFLGIKISPRTSISKGSFIFKGIEFIVLAFSVIISPIVPFPLVEAVFKTPFSYIQETDKPSIFNSQL